jgi:16S rRNA (adenine1518-N6/adenine1519-N6)-dimethyltransferase
MENPYLHPSRIKSALRALELRPTRGMGQNFLVDAHALQQIVAAAELSPNDTVLEIGPGLGVLTWELLNHAGRVVTVELDRRLSARLQEELGNNPRLAIVQSDILRISPAQALQALDRRHAETRAEATPTDTPITSQPYKVVANLPYAITSAVLRHLLEAEPQPSMIVVLVQWEVAARITAKPGDLSILAHSVQVYAEPTIIERVPAQSFHPAPAVDSAILKLRIRPQPLVERTEIDNVMRIIKAGFLQARKKLSNALPSGLASMGVKLPKEQIVAAMEAAGVNPERRAETVTFEEWLAIYRNLQQ